MQINMDAMATLLICKTANLIFSIVSIVSVHRETMKDSPNLALERNVVNLIEFIVKLGMSVSPRLSLEIIKFCPFLRNECHSVLSPKRQGSAASTYHPCCQSGGEILLEGSSLGRPSTNGFLFDSSSH